MCYNALKETLERLTPSSGASIVLGVVISRFSDGNQKFGYRMIPRR
ncbi:hypothetical protein FB561_5441 [Kribbella amoyensis]|uniref:ImpB/mucB/samB family protein n=1 Tax=Kribbella amoyensis TaxID=996641 RepID=A0A561BZB7_9ACTN|nr:hypothetical protein FB561_5441 [Kribbella amoyensis]